MKQSNLKKVWLVLKHTGEGVVKDDILKMSASLAYYTIFSLGPMLIVIIYFADLFWGRQAIEGRVFEQIRGLVGDRAALQIQEVIKNASIEGDSTLKNIFGFIGLFIGATTVFSEIQDSINSIWQLKAKVKKGWWHLLLNRLLSFSLVISLGFLLLVSLIINALVEGLMDRLQQRFPDTAVSLFLILNIFLTVIIIWTLFAIIFKVLPDALMRWKDVAVGALFTTLLFLLGRFLISFYIGSSDVGSTYGTAGSLVVLLLWIYFSSIILYFGAEFTKAYALQFGAEIKPDNYAVTTQTIQVESDKPNVQVNEEDTSKTEATLQKIQDIKKQEQSMNLKTIIFFALIITASSCVDNTPGAEEKEVKKVKPDGTATGEAITTECFSQADLDTVNLKLTRNADSVSGTLYIHRSGKDINNGTFNGTMKGDTLIALYKFNSEGVQSVRQIAFLEKGDTLLEGFGPVIQEGSRTMFTNTGSLTFNNNVKLQKLPCSM